MNIRPPGQEFVLIILNDLDRAAHIATLQSFSLYEFWAAIFSDKIDPRLPIAENVNRLVIVDEDHNAKSVRSKNRRPLRKITHHDGLFKHIE
jgi:hypothetical protein